MPWSERKKSELREEFVSAYESRKASRAELCRKNGNSRKNEYEGLKRNQAGEE